MAANPQKKQRTSALLAFLDVDLENYNSGGESSSDESFKIENHKEDSDFGSSSGSDSDEDESATEKSSEDEPEDETNKADSAELQDQPGTSSTAHLNTTQKLLDHAKSHSQSAAKLLATPVCCACLGDRSDDTNEIVECDGCKITVHEGCYGVSESVSVSSTVSSCSTEPWFCEACKANVKDPDCELCPNRGGIFKETDCGKWVHLVCALYVPSVAFGDVDQLSNVTLFEMQYNRWGAKTCSLCEDERFARTGVCIGCDAGMCKTYFHVTCAQKAGFLSETHHEEVDQADPFYAHCRIHSDKTLIKNRKRNYNALLVQIKHHESELLAATGEKPTPEQERIERKLKKHRIKYTLNKTNRQEPWVPTQKMPRLLTTSASATKKLMKKAELIGVDAVALEFQEAQIASLTDIRKKWHIPPAFSTEFVGYYLDRSIRINEMKSNLSKQVELNTSLLTQQQQLRTKYDEAIKTKSDVLQHQKDLFGKIEELHSHIQSLCPSKQLPAIETIGKPVAAVKTHATTTLSSTPPPQMITNRTMSVPTAAARKQGVGFPLNNFDSDDTGRILSTQRIANDSLMHECGICKKRTDQHLLANCDTCHFFYHLGCLNPPLRSHPKRSKQYAWQCSECDRSDDSAPENKIIPKGPRRSRIRYSKEGPIFQDPLRDSIGSEKSIKSDESHHRTINGSNGEVEMKPEATQDSSEVTPKKRGRKPKAKLSTDTLSPPGTVEINHSESQQGHQLMVNNSIESSPKKGRPKKEKLTPVKTSELVEVEEVKPEVTVMDLSRKVELPLENNRIADIPNSIPYPAELPLLVNHQTSEIQLNGTFANGEGTTSSGSGHHKHKKRKSHKRRHSHSPSSGDRQSSSKKHKRKRKHKQEAEFIDTFQGERSPEQPRIKLKFSKLQGTEQIVWSLPQSQPDLFQSSTPYSGVHNLTESIQSPPTNGHTKSPVKKRKKPAESKKSHHLLTPTSPPVVIAPSHFPTTPPEATIVSPEASLMCDVCNTPGSSKNIVKCDECQKCYHFNCLIPPLKKTPKRRGYSWHCADCDPTDRENN